MGQTIEIRDVIQAGDLLVIDTDRSVGGQDGESFDRGDVPGDSVAGHLAAAVFDAVGDVDHVFVASNIATLRKPGGWDAESVEAARSAIRGFLRFYPDAPVSG